MKCVNAMLNLAISWLNECLAMGLERSWETEHNLFM